MTETPKPKDPKDPPKPEETPVTVPAEPVESAADRRARLRRELAQAELDAAGEDEPPPPPDKVLILSNGAEVETSGAVPTHHTPEGGKYALKVVDVVHLPPPAPRR